MTHKVKIYSKSTGHVEAEILEEKNPKTATAIIMALPFESSVNRWGDEVYFDIPISVVEEDSQREVEVGDLGYWPVGNSFLHIFWKNTCQ